MRRQHAVNDKELDTYYDTFEVRVEDIKIFLDRDQARNHLLTPLNMDSLVFMSIFPSDPKLPTVVLKTENPRVDRIEPGVIAHPQDVATS